MKTSAMSDMGKIAIFAALMLAGMPELASAGGSENVNELLHNVSQDQLGGLPYILSVVCYIGGTFMLVSGALSLKKHAENPTSEPMSKGIARLIVGGAITSVPALAGIIQRSAAVAGGEEAKYEGFTKLNFGG